MNRKFAIVAAAAAAISLSAASCSFFIAVGDGNLVTSESAALDASVVAVSVEGSLDLNVSYGASGSWSMTIDQNLLDKVQVEVKDGVLKVSQDAFSSIQPSSGAAVNVVLPLLSAATITGTGNAVISGFTGGPLQLLSTGTGNMTVSGSGTSLTVNSTGTGDIMAMDFPVVDADITLTGTGDAQLTVSGSLDYTLTGMGNLDVWGAPSVGTQLRTGTGVYTAR